MTGGDWSFTSLAGADLRGAAFADIRMREADLAGVRGEGMSMRNADLSGASFHNADFTRCDFRGSDVSSLDAVVTRVVGAIIDVDQAIAVASAIGFDVRAS